MDVDFAFEESERSFLQATLLQVDVSPYQNYQQFEKLIDKIIKNGHIPDSYAKFCEIKKLEDSYQNPYVFIRNCPLDPDLPFLDPANPVVDKRARKLTYIAEGFLLLYAKLMDQEPIGYINVNDGDIFQDIHPMRSLLKSQSQKAIEPIYFHKDLANHYVRPDWVNIIGLRASARNKVFTCFVSNRELLNALSHDLKDILRINEFYTPYDDLTLASGNKEMGDAPTHPILGGATDYDIRFFENRTIGLTHRAKVAVEELTATLHRIKVPLHVLPGDFIGSANNECIHNKEVRTVTDPNALMNRWLMKTVNVKSLTQHSKYIIPSESRIIAG